tara:strand:- start:1444 stop:2202 length:759 start_codon:yes stop_codon:yes gene_type:complete
MNIDQILEREVPNTREQAGSPEWFAQRVGKATGSGFSNFIRKPAVGRAAGSDRTSAPIPKFKKDYRRKKLVEMITGKCYEEDVNPMEKRRMAHGTMYEDPAIEKFCEVYGMTTMKVGAIRPDSDEPWADRFLVSPDAIVISGPDIDPENLPVVEVKNMGYLNHLSVLETGRCPEGYYPQVQAEILVTGAPYAYFISYHPFMPEDYRMMVCRVERDQNYIDEELIKGTISFLADLDRSIIKVNSNLGLDVCPF